jgi:SAM-dependent methyltransferase
LNVGAGSSLLIDELINSGFNNLTVNDLSSLALEKLKSRMGEKSNIVKFIIDDLTAPSILNNIERVDLWHDRAVLHFFTEKEDQDAYFKLLYKLIKPQGYVILATYNLNGATMCSGLPVFRYDENTLSEKIGKAFELIEYFDYKFTMPSGDTREFVYTLFRRKL